MESLPPDGNGKRAETILLAEDDASARGLTRTVLEEAGYKVIEAVDGEDAVIKFSSNKGNIEMLVLDVIMPKMNGKEVYDAINAIQPGIKTLFMSGYTGSIIYRRDVHEEGLNFIPKPVSPRVVLQRIREILDS